MVKWKDGWIDQNKKIKIINCHLMYDWWKSQLSLQLNRKFLVRFWLATTKAYKMRHILLLFACIVLSVQGQGGPRTAKCKKPFGWEGDVLVDGCEQLTCTAISAKKGVWVEGPAMWVITHHLQNNVLLFRNDCCVYNGTLAPLDTEVYHFSPDNGCTHVNIQTV